MTLFYAPGEQFFLICDLLLSLSRSATRDPYGFPSRLAPAKSTLKYFAFAQSHRSFNPVSPEPGLFPVPWVFYRPAAAPREAPAILPSVTIPTRPRTIAPIARIILTVSPT